MIFLQFYYKFALGLIFIQLNQWNVLKFEHYRLNYDHKPLFTSAAHKMQSILKCWSLIGILKNKKYRYKSGPNFKVTHRMHNALHLNVSFFYITAMVNRPWFTTGNTQKVKHYLWKLSISKRVLIFKFLLVYSTVIGLNIYIRL